MPKGGLDLIASSKLLLTQSLLASDESTAFRTFLFSLSSSLTSI